MQKHLVQPRAVKTTHFNLKNMTFATSEQKTCLFNCTPVNLQTHTMEIKKGNQASLTAANTIKSCSVMGMHAVYSVSTRVCERKRERETQSQREGERESVCVYLCV